MPLVVPGITSDPNDKTGEWTNKLMGKKIGDASDNIVCPFLIRGLVIYHLPLTNYHLLSLPPSLRLCLCLCLPSSAISTWSRRAQDNGYTAD